MAGRARINQHGGTKPAPSSASLGLPDYPKVDMLGLRYTSVNFGSKTQGAALLGAAERRRGPGLLSRDDRENIPI